MSTRNLHEGKRRPARKADHLTAICKPIVKKMWELRRLTPRPVTRIALPLFTFTDFVNNFLYIYTRSPISYASSNGAAIEPKTAYRFRAAVKLFIYRLFKDAVSNSDYVASIDAVTVNWKRWGRKLS
jgi:hypothetical protein